MSRSNVTENVKEGMIMVVRGFHPSTKYYMYYLAPWIKRERERLELHLPNHAPSTRSALTNLLEIGVFRFVMAFC